MRRLLTSGNNYLSVKPGSAASHLKLSRKMSVEEGQQNTKFIIKNFLESLK